MQPNEYVSLPGVLISERLTATDTDVLAGTLLANAGPGRYVIWCVSTVDTATISVSAPGQQVADAEFVPEGPADIHIDVRRDAPWIIDIPPVGGGQQPTIAIGGTTGTLIVLVKLVGT